MIADVLYALGAWAVLSVVCFLAVREMRGIWKGSGMKRKPRRRVDARPDGAEVERRKRTSFREVGQ